MGIWTLANRYLAKSHMRSGKLSGDNPLVGWLNKLWEDVNEAQITSIAGGKLERGARGTRLIIDRLRMGQDLRYRGEYDYDADEKYQVGDIVRVAPANAKSTVTVGVDGAMAGVYICIKAAPAETDLPRNPLQPDGETDYWEWLATWPSTITMCDSDTGDPVDYIVDAQPVPTE